MKRWPKQKNGFPSTKSFAHSYRAKENNTGLFLPPHIMGRWQPWNTSHPMPARRLSLPSVVSMLFMKPCHLCASSICDQTPSTALRLLVVICLLKQDSLEHS